MSLQPGELTTLQVRPPPRGTAAIPAPPPLAMPMDKFTHIREEIRLENLVSLKTLCSHPCDCAECGICLGDVIIPYTGVPGAVERLEHARRAGASDEALELFTGGRNNQVFTIIPEETENGGITRHGQIMNYRLRNITKIVVDKVGTAGVVISHPPLPPPSEGIDRLAINNKPENNPYGIPLEDCGEPGGWYAILGEAHNRGYHLRRPDNVAEPTGKPPQWSSSTHMSWTPANFCRRVYPNSEPLPNSHWTHTQPSRTRASWLCPPDSPHAKKSRWGWTLSCKGWNVRSL